MEESLFWADQIARKIVSERGSKREYTCAAGITPSGVVHIGNFREIITVDLVSRALKELGKEVRFIYSWDDYDRLRKVPANIPKQEETRGQMMMPIIRVQDPWGCHASYADHFEKQAEDEIVRVGIRPEFIRQNKRYMECAYSKEIRTALEKRDAIAKILNKYRKDPLPEGWYPLRIYCGKCGKEKTRVISWNGKYEVTYECECGNRETLDFRKNGSVKLPWRIDWPMRWHYEGVDFEPGGKEHSTPGGSRTTAAEIVKEVYGSDPPVYQMYDFVITGEGGKISSSLGNVITLGDVLKVYTPDIVRFYFAGTKPIKEFSFMFGEDVFKVYEDFYRVERVYFDKEEVSERNRKHMKRVYEMSCVDSVPKSMPVQPGFRKCTDLVNTYGSAEKAMKPLGKLNSTDSVRYRSVLECANNWVSIYGSEKYRAEIQPGIRDIPGINEGQKKALRDMAAGLEEARTEKAITDLIFKATKNNNLEPKDFFRIMYLVLIGKERGPRLAPFILSAGRKKVAELLKKV